MNISWMDVSWKCYRGSVYDKRFVEVLLWECYVFYEPIFECFITNHKVLISTFHGSVLKDFLSLLHSVEGVAISLNFCDSLVLSRLRDEFSLHFSSSLSMTFFLCLDLMEFLLCSD